MADIAAPSRLVPSHRDNRRGESPAETVIPRPNPATSAPGEIVARTFARQSARAGSCRRIATRRSIRLRSRAVRARSRRLASSTSASTSRRRPGMCGYRRNRRPRNNPHNTAPRTPGPGCLRTKSSVPSSRSPTFFSRSRCRPSDALLAHAVVLLLRLVKLLLRPACRAFSAACIFGRWSSLRPRLSKVPPVVGRGFGLVVGLLGHGVSPSSIDGLRGWPRRSRRPCLSVPYARGSHNDRPDRAEGAGQADKRDWLRGSAWCDAASGGTCRVPAEGRGPQAVEQEPLIASPINLRTAAGQWLGQRRLPDPVL